MRTTLPLFALVLTLVFVAACGGTVPNQVLTPPAPVVVPTPPVRASSAWPYHPVSRRLLFAVDQHAVISTKVDTATHVDSIALHAELAVLASTEMGVAGEVTAYAVNGAPPSALNLPLPFRASYPATNRQVTFDMPAESSPCASRELAAVQSFRDLWFRPSDTLRMGATWHDSTTYVFCRDGIPLTATVTRAFIVTDQVGSDARPLLTVTRTSRTQIAGTGTSLGESVTVTGTGTGSLAYTFDPLAGEIVSATGNVLLDLTMRNQLRGVPRVQSVHQAADIHIGRR